VEHVPARQGDVTQGPPEKSAAGKIDAEELMIRFDGDMELLVRLVKVFFAELPKYRDDIAAAIAAGDSHALRHAAHSLKGVLGTFAAHNGREIAVRLEKIGFGGELAGAQEVLAELDLELETIRPLLAGFLTRSNLRRR
jgi:HPt (histidine-containing phosphotransfer) domain-containing protein